MDVQPSKRFAVLPAVPGDGDGLVAAVHIASAAITDMMARSVCGLDAKVTLAQFQTLAVLATRGPQTVCALADTVGSHASTMTRMCDRLVARELATREPCVRDRRQITIALTDSGRTLVEQVTIACNEMIDAAVQRIDPADRIAAVRALHELATVARHN